MDSQSLLAKLHLNKNLVSAHHFALFHSYLFRRPNTSVSFECRDEGYASPGAGKTGSGGYALGGFVVLPFFVATTFKQSRHPGSSVLMGSPCSFGLKSKYSHTQAVAFGFAIIFCPRAVSARGSLLHSVCSMLPAQPPPPEIKRLDD